MAYSATDGRQFTNRPMMVSHNASVAAKPQADDGGQSSLESDPEAMQCIQLLVQKGYTPEQVADAMQDASSGGASDGQQ